MNHEIRWSQEKSPEEGSQPMGSPSEKTFRALNAALRPDYRETVTKEVLEQYKQTAPTTRQRLERALRDRVNIKGFRDPFRAPMVSLLRTVVVRSYRSATVLGALLHVWGELHVDLRKSVHDFLRAQEISIPPVIALEESFARSGSLAPELVETAHLFQTQYPDFHADDVVLMLCYLTGRVRLSRDSNESLREDGQTMK